MSTVARTTPARLNLKKTEQLEIDWSDGLQSVYPLAYLRSMCPCATCKMQREGTNPHDISPAAQTKRKPLLTILPGNYSGPLTVEHAELVGNYALRIDWSDQHSCGIYSFQYLRDISRERNES